MGGFDPEFRDRVLNRLRRLEGQIRGVQRMVQEGRPCPEVLLQIAAVRGALQGVALELAQRHAQACAAAGDPDRIGELDVLLELLTRAVE